MNDQLNVGLELIRHMFQIHMHLRHKKNSAKHSDGRISASHLVMYLLFARYSVRGLTVQIAMFSLGQEDQE